MLSSVENIPAGIFNGLRTDSMISVISRETPLKQDLTTIAIEEKPQVKSPEFKEAGFADVLISQLGIGFPWGNSFEGYWSNQMTLQSKTGAAYACNDCVKLYEPKELIQVRDIVRSERCISSEKGERLRMVLKEILSRGRKVRLSFAGINSISSAFLDEAIGYFYNGNFKEEDLKKIYYNNISKEDHLLLLNVIEWAKEDFRERSLSSVHERE